MEGFCACLAGNGEDERIQIDLKALLENVCSRASHLLGETHEHGTVEEKCSQVQLKVCNSHHFSNTKEGGSDDHDDVHTL